MKKMVAVVLSVLFFAAVTAIPTAFAGDPSEKGASTMSDKGKEGSAKDMSKSKSNKTKSHDAQTKKGEEVAKADKGKKKGH